MEEKGVAYALREADLPQAQDRRPGRAARYRPWDAPVLEHDGFALSETAAITRSVDEAFPGPALQPADARERARMAQVIALADHHLHGPPAMRLLWRAMYGTASDGGPAAGAADEDRPAVEHALDLVEGLIGPGGHLAGGRRDVGYALAYWRHSIDHGGRVAVLDDLWIEPGLRGLGLGSHLLVAAVRDMTEAGARAVVVEADPQDAPAMTFYLCIGFAAKGTALLIRSLLGGA